MRERVEEIGKPPAIRFEELLEKLVRSFELLADDRFPRRGRAVAARYDDTPVANVHAFAERRKRRGRTLDDPREQRCVAGKELQRLVVHRREAVADEGRGA